VNWWVALVLLIGCGLLGWGVYDYAPYNIVAYRSEKSAGLSVSEYKIQISNKVYAPTQLALSVKGLPAGSYKLEPENIELAPASRKDVSLHITSELPKGLHRIVIEARATDGWVGRFGVEHFSARN
jgi:hypothetical protein